MANDLRWCIMGILLGYDYSFSASESITNG